MEQWEIDLRRKLEEELPEGMYNIGAGSFVAYTGKGGKINAEVEFHRLVRSGKYEVGLTNKIAREQTKDVYGTSFTLKDLREAMKNFYNNSKDREND